MAEVGHLRYVSALPHLQSFGGWTNDAMRCEAGRDGHSRPDSGESTLGSYAYLVARTTHITITYEHVECSLGHNLVGRGVDHDGAGNKYPGIKDSGNNLRCSPPVC